MAKRYEHDAFLHEVPGKGGTYVTFPWNIREQLGKKDGDALHVVVEEL